MGGDRRADLQRIAQILGQQAGERRPAGNPPQHLRQPGERHVHGVEPRRLDMELAAGRAALVLAIGLEKLVEADVVNVGSNDQSRLGRSEEHTSELQSLMRISYAVFCLKKKKTNNNKN